jgi:hypothetical protein
VVGGKFLPAPSSSLQVTDRVYDGLPEMNSERRLGRFQDNSDSKNRTLMNPDNALPVARPAATQMTQSSSNLGRASGTSALAFGGTGFDYSLPMGYLYANTGNQLLDSQQGIQSASLPHPNASTTQGMLSSAMDVALSTQGRGASIGPESTWWHAGPSRGFTGPQYEAGLVSEMSSISADRNESITTMQSVTESRKRELGHGTSTIPVPESMFPGPSMYPFSNPHLPPPPRANEVRADIVAPRGYLLNETAMEKPSRVLVVRVAIGEDDLVVAEVRLERFDSPKIILDQIASTLLGYGWIVGPLRCITFEDPIWVFLSYDSTPESFRIFLEQLPLQGLITVKATVQQ